jgi:hypothetical protein
MAQQRNLGGRHRECFSDTNPSVSRSFCSLGGGRLMADPKLVLQEDLASPLIVTPSDEAAEGGGGGAAGGKRILGLYFARGEGGGVE